ncbi:collagen alpha-6(VI) chain-like isoform X5 [Ostrea edulis]|uniref:collagen alpha-6(VI) chain-like isoform X5 n=1 Tax=Ostrea edulis TaxID=37623 RepID=UPI0024B0000A|nr:collagen alpha-6(VI) chain-like isoform X5 [Ostrea edulis]
MMNSAAAQNSLILVVLLLSPTLVQNQRSPFLPRRGVGDEVNQEELEMLASGYDHVYLLNNLNSLNDVRDKLTARFCRGTPAPSTAPCINKPVNMVFFMDATPPRHRLEPQDVDTVADFLTRFTRSIGQSHMFKLTRDGSLKNVLTFTNIKNLLRSLRHSNLRTGLSYDRNILEYDLKPGSVNIVLIIGLPSQLFLVQSPEGYAIHTVAVGIGKNIRREKLEQLVPNSKTFLVQNQSMSTKVVNEMMASDICLGCGDVDLYFILDSSNSIGPASFQRECKLASELVSLMNIRNGNSSITMVHYSDTPELHAYTDTKQFYSSVLTHQWKGGNTMTHLALAMTLKASKGRVNGRRQVGILMSDGASTSPDHTERVVSKIHRSGLEMFVIGIGESVNIEELEMIASSPSRMYMEKSVTASHLKQAICNGAVNDQDKNIPDNNLDCSDAFDIVFVLDSSWSLTTETNFKKELPFVLELVDNLRFDFNRASASVITYADQATEYFFQNKNDFMSTVPNLPWLGGNTFTDRALSKILQNLERKMNSVQSSSDRPLVVVVISDGGSTSPHRLKKVVSRLKQFRFVKLFAIGVGVSINLKELEMMASDPSDSHMFMVDDLEVNNKILKSLLTSQICRDAVYLSVVSPPASVRCVEHVDLVFMLDSSSSLGVVNNPDVNFLKEVAFVIDVIKLGNIDFQQSRVSVITYSDVVILRQYFSESELLSSVIRLPFLGGNTYTHIALQLMLDELKYLKAVSKGSRPAVGVVLTDGVSTRPKLTSSAAKTLHDEGFRIVVFGVGPHVNIRALTEIASLPKKDNLFLLDALDWPTSFLPSLHSSC